MTTAFQSDAFQVNAFQIEAVVEARARVGRGYALIGVSMAYAKAEVAEGFSSIEQHSQFAFMQQNRAVFLRKVADSQTKH